VFRALSLFRDGQPDGISAFSQMMDGAVRGQYPEYAVRKRKAASGINEKPQAEF
jgi:hypothetical protein